MKKIQLLIISFVFVIVNLSQAEDLEYDPAVSTAGDILQIAISSSGYLATSYFFTDKYEDCKLNVSIISDDETYGLKYNLKF